MLIYRSPQWQQISVAKIAHDTKVLICYARDEFEAFAEGRLSAISSYTKSPESIKFQELWTIKLDYSSLSKLAISNHCLIYV
jgi:hypothetical protein